MSRVYRRTQEEWIDHVSSVHQGKYTYKKVDYVKGYLPVTITCPIHGDFTQIANAHSRGRGCSECGKQRKKKET